MQKNDDPQGCCSPTEGALYPALRQFESEGDVNSEAQTVEGRQRKVYNLTDKGFKAYRVRYIKIQATMCPHRCLALSPFRH